MTRFRSKFSGYKVWMSSKFSSLFSCSEIEIYLFIEYELVTCWSHWSLWSQGWTKIIFHRKIWLLYDRMMILPINSCHLKNTIAVLHKGQLISKCPFSVIVWTKIPTNVFSRISALASKKRSNQKNCVIYIVKIKSSN